NVCTNDACNGIAGCVHTNNTLPCDDGNACTYSDGCAAGACVGTPITCTDDQCNHRSCNGTASCTVIPLPNGAACDDGNGCTQPGADTCQSGVCVGGPPVLCTALDQCHVAGTCSPATGCSNPNAPNGTPCNDGNTYTQNDACQGGVCTGIVP